MLQNPVRAQSSKGHEDFTAVKSFFWKRYVQIRSGSWTLIKIQAIFKKIAFLSPDKYLISALINFIQNK